MKPQPECASCILRRAVFEARMVNEEKAMDAVKAVIDVLYKGFGEDVLSAKLWTEAHLAINKALGTDDPYRTLKKQSNDMALKIFPKAEEYYRNAEDKLRAAVLIAIIGNELDFGVSVKTPEEFERKFETLISEGLGVDEVDIMRKYLKGHLVYIVDNCGEIVLDKILIRELKKYVDKITLLVRGVPVLSDATYEDAVYVGLHEEVDDIRTTGVFSVGVVLELVPQDVKELLYNADFIIAKGMGNYEALSEEEIGPIAFLLRTKCWPVARALGVKKGLNVIKVKTDN